jgi:NAD(P)-dependent dehydrogenase (short-subunit alcohol dehydrogenase family)
MTTMALVGAGPGLGAAAARAFGEHGYDLALIARNQERLRHLTDDLTAQGLTARAYRADVTDAGALTAALGRAADDLGPVEVLQYSPIPARPFLRPVLDTTRDDLAAAIAFSVFGPHAAVHQVLPGMRGLGRGTVLFVNGGSGARPNPNVAGTSIAFAGETAFARMLHDVLREENIHVGQLIVPGAITRGHETHDPDALAATLWRMHTARDTFRVFVEPMDIPT